MATIADTIRAALADGKTNEQVLAAVKAAHPTSSTTPACVSYYRSKMKKAGSATLKPAKKPAAVATSLAGDARHLYTVKGIKIFVGNEGQGFNATLYRDGRAVAFVYDDASGGDVVFEWKDQADGLIEAQVEGFNGKMYPTMMTREEQALHVLVSSMPAVVCDWIDSTTGKQALMPVARSGFVCGLVDDALLLKDIARMTRGKVAFIHDGKLFTIKWEPSAANIAATLAKNLGAIVLNGMGDTEALAAVRAIS